MRGLGDKKILITGATGFLGQSLLRRGKELRADLYLTASSQAEHNKVAIKKMDLTDFSEVREVIGKVHPEIVYHFGAVVNLARDFEVAQKCIEVNIKGTLNLLEALKNIGLERFIFTSTEEVYGEAPVPYSENQTVNPPSPYAVSKIAGEYFGRIYAKIFGFKLINLRIGTMYGQGQPKDRRIPQIIIRALRNEEISLTWGKKKRDYIYIDDVVDALILAKDAILDDDFAILNIGSGVSCTLKELVGKVLKITRSKSKCLFGEMPERVLEADEWLLDINRARKLLHWEPKTSLDQGLKETTNHFRRNLRSL